MWGILLPHHQEDNHQFNIVLFIRVKWKEKLMDLIKVLWSKMPSRCLITTVIWLLSSLHQVLTWAISKFRIRFLRHHFYSINSNRPTSTTPTNHNFSSKLSKFIRPLSKTSLFHPILNSHHHRLTISITLLSIVVINPLTNSNLMVLTSL